MGGDWSDGIFNALAERRRRLLLVALLERKPDDALAIPEDVPWTVDDPDAVLTSFHHQHLPVLESLDLVRWDESTRTVVRGPRYGEIQPLLAFIDCHRDELPQGVL